MRQCAADTGSCGRYYARKKKTDPFFFPTTMTPLTQIGIDAIEKSRHSLCYGRAWKQKRLEKIVSFKNTILIRATIRSVQTSRMMATNSSRIFVECRMNQWLLIRDPNRQIWNFHEFIELCFGGQYDSFLFQCRFGSKTWEELKFVGGNTRPKPLLLVVENGRNYRRNSATHGGQRQTIYQ